MKKITIDHYEQIDWADLRARALARKGWKHKNPGDWDAKAASFSSRNRSSLYIDLFIKHLPLDKCSSVLDIGSGPGTLALPIARSVDQVTAMDFSGGMLELLRNAASAEHLNNISTVQCAWEDDWNACGLQPHDLVIASRSMGVASLEEALSKLHSFAQKYVFISDRIGITPFDAGAFSAVGREFDPGPDYIYTLNVLYTMGIYPNIRILTLDAETSYANMDDALRSYLWMFRDITPVEIQALTAYLDEKTIARSENSITIRRESPPKWALIWWETAEA